MPTSILLLASLACADPPPPTPPVTTLTLTTTAWAPGEEIPLRFTCEGSDLVPSLAWSGLPAGTASLALLMEDPDAPDPAAPRMTWTHWVLYDLTPTEGALPEGHPATPAGARAGKNGWGQPGYRGPCPPIGRHRYFFRLYALDMVLPDLGLPGRDALLKAMDGHVMAETSLLGTYQKKADER